MDLQMVRAFEEELLMPAARRNPARVRALLHPDFVEIGRSGERWSREEIIAALASEDERTETDTDEWAILDLAPDVALLTYVIRRSSQQSRHSSVWTTKDGHPRMLFHQGTPIAAP
jgi:ribonuclease HI